ncbi:50S ribosomal protein L33 [Candidatus Gottesmanbacteria bacterium]|nr:50S ribosomal protein L33 [Candidatus Gottesmanbacteria bacterium]
MAKKGEQRILIALICQGCKSQNYITTKNKVNRPEKLVLRKYCRRCRKHTEHKETEKLK